MTQKGFELLTFLVEKNYQSLIKCVVSSRDKNLKQDYYDEIRQLCKKNDVPFFDRVDGINIDADYSIAISWRWLIKNVDNLIVLHDSLLPKYRGFAPLVNALKNGEKEIGVTALFASDDYDRGDIVFQSAQSINYPITIQQAISRIGSNYREVIQFIFDKVKKGEKLTGKRQDERSASYSLWLNDEDYRINWQDDSHSIKRFIDATGYPYKGALSEIEGRKARILDAQVSEDVKIENRTAGKVIFLHEGLPVVACGAGLLKITKAIWDSDQSNIFPLQKFRIKFG